MDRPSASPSLPLRCTGCAHTPGFPIMSWEEGRSGSQVRGRVPFPLSGRLVPALLIRAKLPQACRHHAAGVEEPPLHLDPPFPGRLELPPLTVVGACREPDGVAAVYLPKRAYCGAQHRAKASCLMGQLRWTCSAGKRLCQDRQKVCRTYG